MNKKPSTPPPYRPGMGQAPPPRQAVPGQTPPPYRPAMGQAPPPYQPSGGQGYRQLPQQKNHFWKGCGTGCLASFIVFMVLGVIGLIIEDKDNPPKDSQSATVDGSGSRLLSQGDSTVLSGDSATMRSDSTGVLLADSVTRQHTAPHPTRVWTIDDVPMVHLVHRREYVSDPDGYLTAWQKERADSFLNLLEHACDVQSAFIVVGHVKDKNAQRFAVDLGQKYGISTGDTHRGVTVCLAVADKKFFIATSQGVQSQLTDLKCGRIGDRYIIPNMKAGKTAAAVIQTSEALYYTVSEGQPHLSDANADSLVTLMMNEQATGKSNPQSQEEPNALTIILGILVFIGIIWIGYRAVMSPFRGLFGKNSGYQGRSSYSSSNYSSSRDDDYSSSSSSSSDDYSSSSSSSDRGSYGGDRSYDGGGAGGGW